MSVLVIDDDEHIRVLTELVFRSSGDAVTVAASGRAGLERAAELRPDVVLLDFHLDDMCGADVLAALREDPATMGVPVVFLTARDLGGEAGTVGEGSALGVISKPFDPRMLRETVQSMIHTR